MMTTSKGHNATGYKIARMRYNQKKYVSIKGMLLTNCVEGMNCISELCFVTYEGTEKAPGR